MAEGGGSGEPVQALVVDDSRPMRIILSALLQDLGMVVTHVGDGAQALDELSSVRYDVVFLDWYMPGVTGLELARRIRDRADFDRIRLVMVTSECEDHNIALALEAGVDEYVTKPFDRQVFKNKLEHLGYGTSVDR